MIPREILKEIGIDDLQNAKLELDDEIRENVEEYLVDGE